MIVTNNFITPPVTIEKDMLQGDSLSPFLFNLCFNTLMLMVNQKRVKYLGYTSNTLNFIKHWSQFTDNMAIISTLESDKQHLLNLFAKWCSWSDLIVKIRKCQCCIQQFWGGADFLISVGTRKTVVQLGSLGRCCKPYPVGSRGKTLEMFGYFAFWIAQNITLLALRQGMLTKAYTRNQHFWAFGGLSLGSQTSIPASKQLWIWHWIYDIWY